MSRLAKLLLLAAAGSACTANIDGTAAVGSAGSAASNPDGSPLASAGSSGTAGAVGTAGTGGGTAAPTDPNQPATAQVACASSATETVGHRVLRRLTNAELETSIRANLGFDANQWPGVDLPSDAGSHDGFTNNVDSLVVGPDYASGTLAGAKKLATLVSGAGVLSKLAPCSSQADAACADTFVASLGAKLYRRPLTAAEKARYAALYQKVQGAKEDFKSFAYWAAVAMLQSPYLIYRSEIGEADGAGHFKLTPYEVATELSYTFTAGPPAAALVDLAASNQLATADQIEAAARSLAFDGQQAKATFRDVLLHFSEQWLGLTGFSNIKKDATLYPAFSSDVQTSMAEEARRFFAGVVFDDRGGAASLFTAPYTYVDSTLAKYYGFGAATATGSDFVRVTRPVAWGVGLLAQGSVLATQANALSTSPTRRGYLVRTKLLCGAVPPPPPVVGEIPAPTAAQTTRQRYETLHTANASCKACHSMMDNIGFALEHLDSAGRYRETENGFAIDTSGTISGASNGDVKINGEVELAGALSTLPEATDCVSSYMAAYALGVNHDSATCLASSAGAELRAGGSLVDFYVRLSRSEHFRSRQ